jgi:hypothetical protein
VQLAQELEVNQVLVELVVNNHHQDLFRFLLKRWQLFQGYKT